MEIMAGKEATSQADIDRFNKRTKPNIEKYARSTRDKRRTRDPDDYQPLVNSNLKNDSCTELTKRHHIRNQAIGKITRVDHMIKRWSIIGEQNHTTTAARGCSRTSPR